jgi:putative sterol carrier protein
MTMATGELHDMNFPVLTMGREFITDSGGPGKWRGGLGTSTKIKALAPMFAHTYVIGTKYPMRGFNGGMDGSLNRVVLREGTPGEQVVETTAFETPLSSGDVTIADLGGGGGWGDPLERDPNEVLEDVLDELVSIEGAKQYGVVIHPDKMKVDQKATEKLRKKMQEERKSMPKAAVRSVKYLSSEWQNLCQDAVNRDPEFIKLSKDLTMEMNNIIEECPDGKIRFLYWIFKNGRLEETVVGVLDEIKDREPFFTTIASYDTFMKINTAKMNLETAVMEGKIRFEGDLVKMMEYADALNRFTEVRRTIPTEY